MCLIYMVLIYQLLWGKVKIMYYVILLGILLILSAIYDYNPILDFISSHNLFRELFGHKIFRIIVACCGILLIILGIIDW